MFNGMDCHVVKAFVEVGLSHAVPVFFDQTEGSFNGIIPPVQSDVSKGQVRITCLQFVEHGKNSVLIVHAGRNEEPFMEFHKARRPETFSQGVEGIVSWLDINGRKVGDKILFLFGQLIEITSKSRERKLEIDHDLPLLFNTGVQY